ncbi:hypothetical protein ACTRW9_10355 [Nitrospina sp. 32_T5]|uniref:hypothetical protein n=1 Tax=unclassified Nitrospina TaxID=2638683 RepID=UPI003F95B85C
MPNQNANNNDEFFQNLMGQDDLGVVIRSHIEIENKLNQFLEYVCQDFPSYEVSQPDYFGKVCLALALGLDEEYGGVLKALGKLRNDFAHKLGSRINESNISNLYQAFPKDGKQTIQDAYDKTRKRLPKSKLVKSAKKLEPKSKFAVIATTLRAFLIFSLEDRKACFKEGVMEFDCKCGSRLKILMETKEDDSLKSIPFTCLKCQKGYEFSYKWD